MSLSATSAGNRPAKESNVSQKNIHATINRRRFLTITAQAAALGLAHGAAPVLAAVPSPGGFKLPKLPWAQNALEPVISARTIGLHYGKHHAGYVRKLNKAVAGTGYASQPLEKVIVESWQAGDAKVFNNAAQAFNHDFYWRSLSPKGGGKPTGDLAAKLKSDLGGYDAFRQKFMAAASSQFGSGWAWLVLADGKLRVGKTPNAQTPVATGTIPLLTVDVWEHAYYLDYQNRRGDYVKAVIDKLLNWEFAAARLAGAKA